jgi:hypothetical protein
MDGSDAQLDSITCELHYSGFLYACSLCGGLHQRTRNACDPYNRHMDSSRGVSSKRKIVAAALIFRHGARCMTEIGIDRLSIFPSNTGGANITHEWPPSQRDSITEIGVQQVGTLGRWFAQYVVFQQLATATFKWRSSLATRVLESGRSLFAAMKLVLPASSLPVEPSAYPCDADAQEVFCRWNVDPEYRAYVLAMETSEQIQRAAFMVRKRLEDVYGCLLGRDISSDREDDDLDLARKLFRITYVKELLDCEVAWPATSLAIKNSPRPTPAAGVHAQDDSDLESALPRVSRHAPSMLREAYEYGCGADIVVIPDVKNSLLQRMTPELELFVGSAAWWVWDQRFFAPNAMTKWGNVLAASLLREILMDFRTQSHHVSVYAAHDYTILSILAALRIRKGPPVCLGFCAFMLFECSEEDGQLLLCIKACFAPFPHARAGRPTEFTVSDMVTIVDDIPLVSLEHIITHPSCSPMHP